MKIYSFKIITDYQDSRKLLEEGWFTKRIIKNSSHITVKNNFIFFKFNPEQFKYNFEKIFFLNKHIFHYKEIPNFYIRNDFLLKKNLFFDISGLSFVLDCNDQGYIKSIFLNRKRKTDDLICECF